MKNKFQSLMKQLQYQFKDENLLLSALKHRSMQEDNNERLEFLGDGILNFIIGEALFHRYPYEKEGELSRLRSVLVREATLASLAKEFNLSEFLILGPGELKSGGAKRNSILADAMEAIIGALFLDSNFETCRECVLRWYETRLSSSVLGDASKDSKSFLQEYLQSRKMRIPKYEIIEVAGQPHAQLFQVKCEIPELNLSAKGVATSRRQAEQEAAKLILEKIKQ